MGVQGKTDICNLALSKLGNKGSVENIDTPEKPLEIIFSKWYEVAKEMALKTIKPNFAISRRYLALSSVDPEFGYSNQYRYPSDCLAVLGIGNINDKENNFSIESGTDENLYIITNSYDGESLPLRFIRNVSDVTRFSIEFVEEFSWFLAYLTNMEITQDPQKQAFLEQIIDKKKREAGSLNSMENRPIRKNISHFKQAKYAGNIDYNRDKL